ncbi:hypothetical protein CLAFUR0_09445 [Fulvia fulva]|nr:hypothetical protein CLAFUR0_09445 [Fulvia fulva]
MANAAEAPTTTISTTILSTTFITAPVAASTGVPGNELSTSTSALFSSTLETSSLSSHQPPQPWSSTIAASGVTGTSSQALTSSVDTGGSHTDFPSSATTSAAALATEAANSTTESMIGAEAGHSEQKKAIIGGLSASIAGLLLLGIAICLFLRRRRRRTVSKEFGDWSSEKGMRPPALVRKWTGGLVAVVGKGSPKQTPDRPQSMVRVMVDEENRIIRMNTTHWVRPYAPGSGEGYRDSAPSGQLRIVNPDPSRPASPARLWSDSASSFMKKQRSGLSGFVFGTSRPGSGHKQLQHQHPLSSSHLPPTITVVDPALSRECVASYDQTPSFRSYPSVTSVAIVQQYPVDDPILTPPREESEERGAAPPPHSGLKRPSLATLQSAKGSASRTFSHLGNHLLHPFRSKSSTPAVQRNTRFSTSTNSTRHSRRSDPFDLDAPSVTHPSPVPGRYGPSANGNWTLYEGT